MFEVHESNTRRFYILKKSFIPFLMKFMWDDNMHDWYSERGGRSPFRTTEVMDQLQNMSFGMYSSVNGRSNGTIDNPLYSLQDQIVSVMEDNREIDKVRFLHSQNDYYNSQRYKEDSRFLFNSFLNLDRRNAIVGNPNINNSQPVRVMYKNNTTNTSDRNLLYNLNTFVYEQELNLVVVHEKIKSNPASINELGFLNKEHENGRIYRLNGVLNKTAANRIFNTTASNNNINIRTSFIDTSLETIDSYYRSDSVSVSVGVVDDSIHQSPSQQSIPIRYFLTKDTTLAGFGSDGVNGLFGGVRAQIVPSGECATILGINGRVDGNYVENAIPSTQYCNLQIDASMSISNFFHPDVTLYTTLFNNTDRTFRGCIFMVKWLQSSNRFDQSVTRIYFVLRLVLDTEQVVGFDVIQDWIYEQQPTVCANVMTYHNNLNASNNVSNDVLNGTYIRHFDTEMERKGPEVKNYKTFINRHLSGAGAMLDNNVNPSNLGEPGFIILNHLRKIAISFYRAMKPQDGVSLEFVVAFILRYKQKGDESHLTDAYELDNSNLQCLNSPPTRTRTMVCSNDGYLEKFLLMANISYVHSSTSQRTFYFAPYKVAEVVAEVVETKTGNKRSYIDSDSAGPATRTRSNDQIITRSNKQRRMTGGNSTDTDLKYLVQDLKQYEWISKELKNYLTPAPVSSEETVTNPDKQITNDIRDAVVKSILRDLSDDSLFTGDGFNPDKLAEGINNILESNNNNPSALNALLEYKYRSIELKNVSDNPEDNEYNMVSFRGSVLELYIVLSELLFSVTDLEIQTSEILDYNKLTKVLKLDSGVSIENNRPPPDDLIKKIRDIILSEDDVQDILEYGDRTSVENEPIDTMFDVLLHWLDTIGAFRVLTHNEDLIRVVVERAVTMLKVYRKIDEFGNKTVEMNIDELKLHVCLFIRHFLTQQPVNTTQPTSPPSGPTTTNNPFVTPDATATSVEAVTSSSLSLPDQSSPSSIQNSKLYDLDDSDSSGGSRSSSKSIKTRRYINKPKQTCRTMRKSKKRKSTNRTRKHLRKRKRGRKTIRRMTSRNKR